MASIRQRGNRWQCRVTRHGFPPETKSFATKADAETWARSIEVEMDKGTHQNRASVERTTLADVLLRYAEEVTPCKKGAKDEAIRLNALRLKLIATRNSRGSHRVFAASHPEAGTPASMRR